MHLVGFTIESSLALGDEAHFGLETGCNRHMSNRYCSLLASKQTAVSVWLLYVQSSTLDDGRKDRPKHVECYSIKINLRRWCIWLVLL